MGISKVIKALGIQFGTLSAALFIGHYASPIDVRGTDLIKGVSNYIEVYEGNPRDTLKYIDETLNLLKEKYPSVKEIGELQSKIEKVLNEDTPDTILRPFVKEAGKELKELARRGATRGEVVGATLFLVAALACLGGRYLINEEE